MINGKHVANDLWTRSRTFRDGGYKLEEAVFLVAAHLLDPNLVGAVEAATIADCADMPDLAHLLVSRALERREKNPEQRDRLLLIKDGIEASQK